MFVNANPKTRMGISGMSSFFQAGETGGVTLLLNQLSKSAILRLRSMTSNEPII